MPSRQRVHLPPRLGLIGADADGLSMRYLDDGLEAEATDSEGRRYIARIEGPRVLISEICDGGQPVHATAGRWTGEEIIDAPAPLGEEVYEALEAALAAASY